MEALFLYQGIKVLLRLLAHDFKQSLVVESYCKSEIFILLCFFRIDETGKTLIQLTMCVVLLKLAYF